MIQGSKNGTELSTKLAELRTIEKSEAYNTALQMKVTTDIVDRHLARARRMEREGKQLIAEGISVDRLREIVCSIGVLDDGD